MQPLRTSPTNPPRIRIPTLSRDTQPPISVVLKAGPLFLLPLLPEPTILPFPPTSDTHPPLPAPHSLQPTASQLATDPAVAHRPAPPRALPPNPPTMVSPFVPLAAAAVVVGILSLVGFVVYEIFNDIAEKTAQKMEKKNITFGKEGVRVGIKEVKNEDYVEKTQRCAWPPFISFVCVFPARVPSVVARVPVLGTAGHGAGARAGEGGALRCVGGLRVVRCRVGR